jgi:plastocyanin
MKRSVPFAAATMVLACIALAAPASAGLPAIIVADDEFVDDTVTIDVDPPGGVVIWHWDALNENSHNVRQDRALFKSGPPVEVDDDFEVDPSAGTFRYYCTEHGGPGGVGMSGVLRVRPRRTDPSPVRGINGVGVTWSPGTLQSGDRFDVQFKVGDGKWRTWKKNTLKHDGFFGRNGNPVTLNPSKTYRIRARSELSANPKKRSGWSPPLLIEFT